MATPKPEKLLRTFIRQALKALDPTTTLEAGTGRYAGRYALVSPSEVGDGYDISEVTGELREVGAFLCAQLPRA